VADLPLVNPSDPVFSKDVQLEVIEPNIRQLQDLEVASDEEHAVQRLDSLAMSSKMDNCS
jgi:hypothetical protein